MLACRRRLLDRFRVNWIRAQVVVADVLSHAIINGPDRQDVPIRRGGCAPATQRRH